MNNQASIKFQRLQEHASQLFANMNTISELLDNRPLSTLYAYIQAGDVDEYNLDNLEAVRSAWNERWREIAIAKAHNSGVTYGLFSNFDPTGFQFHRIKIVHCVSDKGQQYVTMHPSPPISGEWVFEVFQTEKERENRILELQ